LKNSFGQDDRVDVVSPTGVLAAVGRIDSGCTGVRVGKALVLTAAHCVVDDAGAPKPLGFIFRQQFADGAAQKSYAVDRAWYGSNAPDDDRLRDFAVLKLAAGSGDDAAIPAVNAAVLGPAAPVTLAGFATDRDQGRVMTRTDCTIREVQDGRYLNDCDAATGISGAPLLAGDQIVGMAVSEYRNGAQTSVHRDDYSDDYANVALPAAAFAPLVASLLASVDQGGAEPTIDQIYTADNPTPAEERPGNEELNQFQWRHLRSGTVRVHPGAGSFDLAIAGSQRLNPLRATFRCADVQLTGIAAITKPEGNDWEAGALFAGEAARFSNGGIQFARIAFTNRRQSDVSCAFELRGAVDQTTPVLPRPESDGRRWACAATPGHYQWTATSLDFARYQALSACTFGAGIGCQVACEPVQ
jgi:protease YdgD